MSLRRIFILLPLFWITPLFGQTVPTSKVIPEPPAAITKPQPESIEDLKAFQNQTKAILDKVFPSIVCLKVGNAFGSGVIVNKEGLILTAGHVSGEPDKDIQIILRDGKVIPGKTLGRNKDIDSGMVKITKPGDWPFVELGVSKEVKKGDWCIAVGHPGGYKTGRSPVVRVGRIGLAESTLLRSDCTISGGDSGGPLFDMRGRLIGIHSRIGNPLEMNIHVPVDTYRDTWDRLVSGEKIGETTLTFAGAKMDLNAKDCKVAEVASGSVADKAGMKVGDIITAFSGKEVKTNRELQDFLKNQKPMEEFELIVRRNEQNFLIRVALGK